MISVILFGDETSADDVKTKNIRQTGECVTGQLREYVNLSALALFISMYLFYSVIEPLCGFMEAEFHCNQPRSKTKINRERLWWI